MNKSIHAQPTPAYKRDINIVMDQLNKVQAELNELRKRVEALERKPGFFDE